MPAIPTVELALEHLEGRGLVTDLSAPSLADPETRALLLEALAARRGRPPGRVTSTFAPGRGVVRAAFDPAPPHRGAKVAAIRLAVEGGAMAPVRTRTGSAAACREG